MGGALEKLRPLVKKNGPVILVLLLGLILMLWPQKKEAAPAAEPQQEQTEDLEEKLEAILALVEGAGETRVLLSLEIGEQTVFQADETSSTQEDRQEKKSVTVTVTDGSRQQQGLVRQVAAPTYRGAVVVCRGGGDPRVKLSVVEAVSGVTGLPSNQITVLKMK